MSPIKRLSPQVRALQAQDYAAVEHYFQDEPVDCPEDISVDKLDVVFERRHVSILHRSESFTLWNEYTSAYAGIDGGDGKLQSLSTRTMQK